MLRRSFLSRTAGSLLAALAAPFVGREAGPLTDGLRHYQWTPAMYHDDRLYLVAGTGITITTDEATDTITITATGTPPADRHAPS